METIFKGRLLYLGWNNFPWKLVTEGGDVDLWLFVEEFFRSLNGKRAYHDQEITGYTLRADTDSAFEFDYDSVVGVWLKKPDGFAGSNVLAHMESALIALSGRLIEVKITDSLLQFTADHSENVLKLDFLSETNSYPVPRGDENRVCRIGKPDCCIFLSLDENGFSCLKFNSFHARKLLERLAVGTIRSTRIGNCGLL